MKSPQSEINKYCQLFFEKETEKSNGANKILTTNGLSRHRHFKKEQRAKAVSLKTDITSFSNLTHNESCMKLKGKSESTQEIIGEYPYCLDMPITLWSHKDHNL